MDEIHEEKLSFYRRIETLIRDHEENEAKVAAATANATHQDRTSSKASIGPANDLIRFLYILQQQYLDDTDDVRRKAREDLLEYMQQFQPSDVTEDDDDQDEEETNEEQDAQQSKQSADLPQPTSTTDSNMPPIVLQPVTVIPPPPLPAQAPVLPVATLPSTQATSNTTPVHVSTITDWAHITANTLEHYEKILAQAEQYRDRYRKVDSKRDQLLVGPIRNILNKLRQETQEMLTRDIFDYLSGNGQKLGSQFVRIENDEERLLCLSNLADSILRQLLGVDLNEVKTEILLPFILSLTRDQRTEEFRILFLYHLHKRCPYTVPLYPKRLPAMSDVDYRKAMGYEEKKSGDLIRLETDDEFLDRMSGLIRLFCKLATRDIPPFDKDLSFGWQWCSNLLNLPVQPDLTVLLLRVFLHEVGPLMLKAYPQQFPMLLRTIKKNSAKLCENTSPSEKVRFEKALDVFARWLN